MGEQLLPIPRAGIINQLKTKIMKNVNQFGVAELNQEEVMFINGGEWSWFKFALSPLPYSVGYLYGTLTKD